MHCCTGVFLEAQRKKLLQRAPSEGCLRITKYTSLKIANVVDLTNIVLLVTKKIRSSINPECKIMSQVRKIMFKQTVRVLFEYCLKALE